MREQRTSVRGRLQRARRAWLRRRLREALVVWLSRLLPGLALLFGAGLLLPPTPAWSIVAGVTGALWILLSALLWLGLPLRRPPSPTAYALWLEERGGLARNELINALDLEREADRWSRAISRDLVRLALWRATERIAGLPLGRLHRTRRLRRPLVTALGAVACVALLVGLWPLRSGDSLRLFLSAGDARVLPEIALRVGPGDTKIERGQSLTVRAEVSGRRRPASAEIEMRAAGGEWARARMARGTERDSLGADGAQDTYLFLLGGLGADMQYRVATGWAASPVYTIRVLERLQASGYHKRYTPPAYTGLATQEETSSVGDLAGVAGTRVELEVRHRRSGISGRLEFAGQRSAMPLRPLDGRRLGASWTLERTAAYWVELTDAQEGEQWRSDTFHVAVVPDLPPVVRLLSPPDVILLPEDQQVALEIDAVDDFGLRDLALIYGRGSDDPERRALPLEPEAREARLRYVWDLETVTLLPGQELHYYLQVRDNNGRDGPQSGETSLHTIRFPSLAELYQLEERERRAEIADLEETLQGQQTLREELEEVAREMLKEEQVSWEKQQEIADLVARQQQLAERVEAIRQSLESSQARMQNQNLFTPEMVAQIEEIQQLMGEIQSREFHQLVERMQQALRDVDREALQRAMEEMKFSQEEITQSLDRTLEMLRRLLAVEQLDELLQKIMALEMRQAEINRQLEMVRAIEREVPSAADSSGASPAEPTEASEPTDAEEAADAGSDGTDAPSEQGEAESPLSPETAADLAAEQKRLEEELEALREALAELEASSRENLAELSEALEEYRRNNSFKETREQMKQAQQAMNQCQRQTALKFGRKAREGLQKMQGGMMAMKQRLSAEEAEALARALYEIAHRLVHASQVQEALAAAGARLGPRELALRQQELYEEISVVSDSLLAVARKTPTITRGHLRALGEVLRDIARARDQLTAGRRPAALALTSESSRKLNAATKALLEAAMQARGMCSSNCNNPFNQMQMLTGQQSALNRDTAEMLAAGQMPRLSAGQQEARMRLAARQEMVRQGLSEIQGELEGSGKLLGEIDDVLEEMEEVERELRARDADRRIVERQERILSRLLSAQRSLRKQDQTEQRQSRVGVDPQPRTSPPAVEMGHTPAERLRRAMLRGSQDPVPVEYRRIIELYMQQLMQDR
ncbi:MAG: hypothetical protein GF330_11710 [Candidatus Eisenbacteria bacterium]|nr:hypothetical protein [Candidatus Eisenbacteria bacterium]